MLLHVYLWFRLVRSTTGQVAFGGGSRC